MVQIHRQTYDKLDLSVLTEVYDSINEVRCEVAEEIQVILVKN